MGTKKARSGKGNGQEGATGKLPAKKDHNRSFPNRQDVEKTFLLGSLPQLRQALNGCQSATSLTGFSEELKAFVVIQIRCKRWGCRHCGERKINHYAHKVASANPNRFITLTVANRLYESPREAYDKTRRALPQLTVKTRRKFGEFEYFRVLETTKKGWPHYHLVARSKYIPHQFIKGAWFNLTGASIVDVRQIKKNEHIYRYVMKYLAKQSYVPWTDRRISWTRNFFPEQKFEKGKYLQMRAKEFWHEDPAEWIWKNARHKKLVEYSQDCWALLSEKEWLTVRDRS